MHTTSTTTEFENAQGVALSARLDTPPTPRGYALFAHCFTCSKNFIALRRIVNRLVEHRIAVFSFDFTGLGASEGSFADSHFSGQTSDLIHAVNFIKQQYAVTPTIVIGHSLGGTAALYAARLIPELKGVVTIGSPSDPAHVANLFNYSESASDKEGAVEVNISGRPFRITKEFVDDLRNYPPAMWLHEIKQDVLILHSPLDTIVDIQHAEQIFLGLKHPKSFVSLDRAGHLLERQEDADFVASVVSGWAERHFGTQPSDPPHTSNFTTTNQNAAVTYHPALKQGWQVITRIGETSFKTDIQIKKHHHYADEPKRLGGEEQGPTPFEHLLGSLGACTVMTLRLYARRKKWNLREARAYLDLHRDPEKIVLGLELFGDLDNPQRQRLLEIADRCPVHVLLSRSVDIESTLIE